MWYAKDVMASSLSEGKGVRIFGSGNGSTSR